MKVRQAMATAAIALISLAGGACTKKVPLSKAPVPPAAAPVPASTPSAQPAPASLQATSTPVAATPASRFPDAATRARIDQLLARISDAYFDYDKFALRADAVKTLQTDSVELRNILANYP